MGEVCLKSGNGQWNNLLTFKLRFYPQLRTGEFYEKTDGG
jgi:hypothetical protein